MPLSAANFVANSGVVRAQDLLNFHNLFTGVMTDQPVSFGNSLTVAGNVTATAPSAFLGNGAVPTGGTTGQVLSKSSATNYALGWITPFTQAAADARYLQLTGGAVTGPITGSGTVPAGGSAAQVLTKNSATSYDLIWATPSGGALSWTLKGPADTVGAPNYSFAASTGTGMYSPASNTVGLTAGGVQALSATATLVTVPLASSFGNTITVTAGNVIVSNGYLSLASNQPILWNNDQAHKIVDNPATNTMSFYEWQSEMRYFRGDTGTYFRLRGLPTATGAWSLENSNGDLFLGPKTTLSLVSNGYHDGSAWQRWDTTQPSGLLQVATSSLLFYTVVAGTGAISAWLQKMTLDVSGNMTLAGSLTINAPSTGGIFMVDQQSIRWPDAQHQISVYNQNMYFDLTLDSTHGWQFRSSGGTPLAITGAGGLNAQSYIVTQNATDILKSTTAGDISANNHLIARYDLYANRDVYATGRVSAGSSISVGTAGSFVANSPAALIACVQRVGAQICLYDVGSGNCYGFGVNSNELVLIAGGTTVGMRASTYNGTQWFQFTGSTLQLTQNQQIQWAAGHVIFPSGTTLYHRSGGSGASHLFQDSGGGWAPVTCGSLSTNGVVDASSWIRGQPGTIYLTTLGGTVGIQVDNATNGNWNGYAPNGSGNFRWQHADGSWCGTQAANFQVQSALKNKLDIHSIQDRVLALLCEPTLRGVGYTVRSDGSQRVGFIADAWQEFLPEAVGLDAEGEVETFDYDQVVPILWEVVRRLAQEMGLCR